MDPCQFCLRTSGGLLLWFVKASLLEHEKLKGVSTTKVHCCYACVLITLPTQPRVLA